jgi:hypothetical protein
MSEGSRWFKDSQMLPGEGRSESSGFYGSSRVVFDGNHRPPPPSFHPHSSWSEFRRLKAFENSRWSYSGASLQATY